MDLLRRMRGKATYALGASAYDLHVHVTVSFAFVCPVNSRYGHAGIMFFAQMSSDVRSSASALRNVPVMRHCARWDNAFCVVCFLWRH